MRLCKICEEEKEEFNFLHMNLVDVFGGASRYHAPTYINELCTDCDEVLKPYIKDARSEHDDYLVGAAFALWMVEENGLARRGALEDLAIEKVGRWFSDQLLETLQATRRYVVES